MYLDGFGNFFEDFCPLQFFKPLFKIILGQKTRFWRYFKNTDFSQKFTKNLTIQIDSL